MACNNYSLGVPSMYTYGLFIGVVTHGHYIVRNAPATYPSLSLCSHDVIMVL
jgi:hypothetical protein